MLSDESGFDAANDRQGDLNHRSDHVSDLQRSQAILA
jgi:hypothetical protein